MDQIYELINTLEEAIKAKFPEGTKFSVLTFDDGYKFLSVEKWEHNSNKPIEERLRRDIFDAYYSGNKWGNDESCRQNEFYARKGVLLEG